MYKKFRKITCTFLILTLFVSIAAVFEVASAAEPVRLYVDPPSIINTGIGPCQSFNVTIKVANVERLYGWQIKLTYNPAILECTKVLLPTGHMFTGLTFTTAGPYINNNAGDATYGANIIGTDSVNGSGSLCKYTFHVKSRGACAIAFSKPYGMDTYLIKLVPPPTKITTGIVVEDGYFSNRLPAAPALIFVDPPRIVNLTLVPCQNFSINVSIINASYLYSFRFKLSFDPGMLNATGAVLGNIFLPVTPTVEINNTVGYVLFSASLSPPQTEVSGNGTLAVITFHVEGLGQCHLTLSDTALADSTGGSLPHSTSDGYFNNVLLAKLRVEPPEIIDPTLVPPATFEINITLADVEDLYGYEFNLSFTPDILACLSVNIHDVLNETNYTPEFAVNNIKGFVWIRVTYYPPAVPITSYPPLTLVTLKFRVKGMGATPLDLHDTSLTNSLGQPIPHEAFDGIVVLLIRDVAVINVVPSPTKVYQGQKVYINVTVRNEGNLTETFDVKCYYGDNNLIGTINVKDLPPDEETTLKFTWETQSVTPCHNYTIWAEAVAVPYEIDKADNIKEDGTVKIKMMGDIDGDGKVDMLDVAIACAAFATFPGHPRWNPDADVDGNGKVDMMDTALVCYNFLKKC